MRDPRRDHYLPPGTGNDTHAALEAAITELGRARGMWPCDAATELHLVASVAAEIEHLLPHAVAGARRQGCTWAEIADLLGVTRASAWQRYAPTAAGDLTSVEATHAIQSRATTKEVSTEA